jgi:hypothetical protein
MPDDEVLDLMARSGIGFVGTVRSVATGPEAAAAERTVVVRVDELIHAPEALTGLAGSDVVVRLDPGLPAVHPGDQWTFFADVEAFAGDISVREVGRLPAEAVRPQLLAATQERDTPRERFGRLLRARSLREHAGEVAAVVVARVVGLEKAGPERFAEHDPDWWRASLDVRHVEAGEVAPGPMSVLYANSLDVRWRRSPKPKAGQEGLWLLHATAGAEHDLAPYVLVDPEDYQPAENLSQLRADG